MFEFNPTGLLSAGISSIVWGTGIFVVVLFLWRNRKLPPLGTSMVLQKFKINVDPSAPVAIEIRGRAKGLVSWVLTLLKLEPNVEFVITANEVSYRAADLSGVLNMCIPLTKVDGAVCIYRRSTISMALTIVFGIGFALHLLNGIIASNSNLLAVEIGTAFVFLIFAIVAALFFYFSKHIAISLQANTSSAGVCFKRSVIENVSVDMPEAIRAISVINARLLAAHPVSTVQEARQSRLTSTPTIWQCASCSASNALSSRFCENCGSSR